MDESLSYESFLEGAKKAAHKAMDDHGRGEYDEFALHAGVAIERLAKATLFKMNPLYIASGKVQIVTEQKKFTIHTISMSEALARLAQLGIGKVTPSLRLLIDLRNGTVHASGGDEAKTHISTLAKAISAMLEHLEISEHAFWGRFTSSVNIAVDEQRSEIERDVEIRIKQARHLFEDRFAGLPEGMKERALQIPEDIVSGLSMSTGDTLLITISTLKCPACGEDANITMTPISASSTGATVRPDHLSCRVCGLELNGPEEIRASAADIEKAVVPSTISVSWGPTLRFPVGVDDIRVH